MNTAGIIAEYNPFHGGHSFLIEQTRAALGEDTAIVCAMSGNFVQRGEAAIFRKGARAEAAVRCGADLVLELPLPWATASAEGFARGGVELLAATGVVTHLSFGSESGELTALTDAARLLRQDEMNALIKKYLESGISYAAARQLAFEELGGASEVLSGPNNILALEYIMALDRLKSGIVPMTVKRTGTGHDERGSGAVRSASQLRSMLLAGEELSAFMPRGAAEVFRRELASGREPVCMERLENAVLARVRMLPEAAFDSLPGASEGLGSRLYRAVRECASSEEILARTKSKRYAASRIRRMLLSAFLGIEAGESEKPVPYVRVLAMSEKGRALLREMSEKSTLPVIVKPAQLRKLGGEACRVFSMEAAAADLYNLAYSRSEYRVPGEDWRYTPTVL